MKKYVAFGAASALMLTQVSQANAQAEAVAIISLASTLVGLGSNNANVEMTAIMAQSRMIEALHYRLDAIENSIGLILVKIDNLPDVFRKELADDHDILRAEDTSSAINRLIRSEKQLAAAKKAGAAAVSEQSLLVELAIQNLQEKRDSLFKRSDFVVKQMAAALIAEMTAIDENPAFKDRSASLSEYYARLLAVASPDSPGSLYNLRADLEKLLAGKTKSILHELTGKDGDQLQEQAYFWYVHTKNHTEDRVKEEIKHVSRTSEGRLAMSFDMAPYSVHYAASVPDHTRHVSRSIIKTQIGDADASGLYHLSLAKNVITEALGDEAGSIEHTGEDADFEAGKDKENGNLNLLLEDYNRLTDALLGVRQLEAIATAARFLILQWNDKNVTDLSQRLDKKSIDAGQQLDDINRAAQEKSTKAAVQNMESARERSRQIIEEGHRQVEAVMARARKDHLGNEFIIFAKIFSQSFDVYNTVKADFSRPTPAKTLKSSPSAALPLTRPDAGKESVTESDPPQPFTPPAEPHKDIDTDASVEAPQDKSEASEPPKVNLAERPEEITRSIYQDIERIKQHPASSWDKLPDDLTQEEISLMEDLQTLKALPETEADRTATDPEKQIIYDGTNALNALVHGGPAEAIKNIASSALTPDVLGDGTLAGAGMRKSLEIDVNQLMQGFFLKRFSAQLQSPIVAPQDPCATAKTCLRPVSPAP